MKALIITYYWPPAGGSGVQRWLYFVKYLREFGIEPVVFTVENPNYPIQDSSLKGHIPEDIEIIRQKIFEPNTFFGKKNLQTGAGFLQQKPSFFQKTLQYIRANFFIPDARKFWIKPSVRTLSKYLQKNKVDWFITTGPPHSVHLIGKKLKERTDIKWLADFRDPWTDIDYFHLLPLTARSLQKHEALEDSVISTADMVSVVSKTMLDRYISKNKNCFNVPNGFDGEIVDQQIPLDKKFTLTHVGSLNADRNPNMFWKAIRAIIDENPNFEEKIQINIIGIVANEVLESIDAYELGKYVNCIDYIPHDEVFSHMKKSQVLLLFLNNVPSAKGIVTGKVYEYLKAKRPILAMAPINGDLAEIIERTNAGKVTDFNELDALKKNLYIYFDSYIARKLIINSKNIQKYHRKNLTAQLAELLKNN